MTAGEHDGSNEQAGRSRPEPARRPSVVVRLLRAIARALLVAFAVGFLIGTLIRCGVERAVPRPLPYLGFEDGGDPPQPERRDQTTSATPRRAFS